MKSLFPLLLSLTGTVAAAEDAAWRQCRTLAEPAARLACYDALPLPAVTPPSTSAPNPAPAARVAVATAATAASFGLASPEDKLQAITSRIPGHFDGWGPRAQIKLANGQVWQVTDDSRAVYNLRDPQVTVRRATLGGFVMDIEGANQVPRVRRVE